MLSKYDGTTGVSVNFNWDDALDQIFGLHLVCPRCRQDQDALVVGYVRKQALTPYAPRHIQCEHGDECEARKLVTLCEPCAAIEHFRGEVQDAPHVFVSYMLDCRRELDEWLDYVADDWREDTDLQDEDLDRSLEEVDPDAFAEEMSVRRRLEEEYLRYHRELRQRHHRIPEPGWRSAYVEDVRELGHDTLLGD
jgi:hypothetical protein